jgi:hypothetical protein
VHQPRDVVRAWRPDTGYEFESLVPQERRRVEKRASVVLGGDPTRSSQHR